MSSDQSLIQWMQEQYWVSGIDSTGSFIGKFQFMRQLVRQLPESELAKGHSKKFLKREIHRLINAGLYLPSTISSAEKEPQSNPTSALQVASLPNTANSPLSTSISGNGQTIDSARSEFGASLGSDYDSGIDTQSNPPLTNGEPRHVHDYENPGIQSSHQNPRSLETLSCVVRGRLNSKIQELKNDVERISYDTVRRQSKNNESSDIPTLESQLQVLGLYDYSEGSYGRGCTRMDVRDAVIYSPEVVRQQVSGLLPQYGLLGSVCPDNEVCSTANSDPRLFVNTNIPFSAFICGLQGSGKSHTMSTLLENCLIKSHKLGLLQSPLSALVFYFGQYTSRLTFRPCEAAFLAYPHPDFRECAGVTSVNVLAAPSNYHNLSDSYMQIPRVSVRPFKLRSKDLNIRSMLTLMSVDQTQTAPLYMGQITRILREIATASAGDFNYKAFKTALEACNFSRAQRAPLQQRIELLESFLDLEDAAADHNFEAGSITIIDLSCPFVDANTACALFNIYMSIYLESDLAVGKVIAIDEAHKYMADTPASKDLTESLLTVIRQQRHYGARVIISTQEPTISPRLIDLCSMFIIHRFSSPEWFEVIRRHVSIGDTDKTSLEKLFRRIINLRVGEALLFAPTAILSRRDEEQDVLFQLSSSLVKIKMRKRLTWDGGKSVVCV